VSTEVAKNVDHHAMIFHAKTKAASIAPAADFTESC
jgi:hypothetical protein